MPPEQLISLSKVRFEKAETLLLSSQALIDIEDYKSSANRSYYAIFNAMRACLALDSVDFKKHSAVISDFRVKFIKTKIMRPELSGVITKLFEVRNQCDYNDFYIVSKQDVAEQLESAKVFVKEVSELLYKLWQPE